MSDILLRLSRADAGWWRDVMGNGAGWGSRDHAERVLSALDAALAAPAEGPERAATGETGETDDAPETVDPAYITAIDTAVGRFGRAERAYGKKLARHKTQAEVTEADAARCDAYDGFREAFHSLMTYLGYPPKHKDELDAENNAQAILRSAGEGGGA